MLNYESEIREEFEVIRCDIQGLIAQPVDKVDFDISYFKGITEQGFGGRIQELPNLSLPRAKELFRIIKEELKRASGQGIRLDLHLREIIIFNNGGGESQDKLGHELAHLRKATELGVDLEQCSLRYVFLKDLFEGLGLRMEFEMPPRTDLAVKILVALAPDKISDEDRKFVERKVPKLTPEQREELRGLLEVKAGILIIP